MTRSPMLWLAALALASGCGRAEEPESTPAQPTEDPRPIWSALLAQERGVRADRPALFEPGSAGDAAGDYRRITLAVPDSLAKEADELLARPERFAGASAALRSLAGGAEGQAAIGAAVAGASRAEGRSWASGEDQLEEVRRGPVRAVLLAALSRGAAGKPEVGARAALATARMAHDLARGGGLHAAMTARAIERQAYAVLRQLVTHPKLTVAELRGLLAALDRLSASRPRIADAMVIDIDAAAARVLASEATAGAELGMHPDAALAALLEQRKIAVELAQQASRPLPAQQAWFEGRACMAPGGATGCKRLSRYLIAAALAEAHARATRIMLAAELERRGGGKSGEPPLDPVTGKPFEIVEADGSKVIRRGASPLDGEPGAEPRDVPVAG